MQQLETKPCAVLLVSALLALPAAAQVDQTLAAQYIAEANQLAEAEAGRTWGLSLAGPMVFFDAKTQTIATSHPEPKAKRPALLGYANAMTQWGDQRWSTYVWQHVPKDDRKARAQLLIHELTHRIQPELGHFQSAGPCSHLDTLEGRYFMQLEWRALAKALTSKEEEQRAAIADAMGFRQIRHELFPKADERERCDVIREGLAQYTAVHVVHPKREEAVAEVLRQLLDYAQRKSFVGEFAYPTGAAYGVLLDGLAPGWTRSFQPEDDLGRLLLDQAGVEPNLEVDQAAERYGGSDLMLAEEHREALHLERVAAFRKEFIEGPVLNLPRASNMSFRTDGKTSIPGAGTMFPSVRTTSVWGKLEADWALVPADQHKLTLTAPTEVGQTVLKGKDWSLTPAQGWSLRAGPRQGDFELVFEEH